MNLANATATGSTPCPAIRPHPVRPPPHGRAAARGRAEHRRPRLTVDRCTAGTPAAPGAGLRAGDVVRWAAFSCVLVPVVLVVYGTSFGGAAGAALGLAAVTAVCRVLLRQSERGAARSPAEEESAHRGAARAQDGGAGRIGAVGTAGGGPHRSD